MYIHTTFVTRLSFILFYTPVCISIQVVVVLRSTVHLSIVPPCVHDLVDDPAHVILVRARGRACLG